MVEHVRATRTVHVVLPTTHRSLCGYEEEHGPSEGASTVACPECTALLRSGLVSRSPRTPLVSGSSRPSSVRTPRKGT
jgi:hypothetical protein